MLLQNDILNSFVVYFSDIVPTNISQHNNVLIMKANKMHYFSNLFDEVLYMFRTRTLSIIRSISTLYTCNKYLSC